MNEDWSISQDGNIVHIRDGDGLLVAKFKYDPLSKEKLDALLDLYKYFYEKVCEKIDEAIINGGI